MSEVSVFHLPDHIELLPGTTGRVIRRTDNRVLLLFEPQPELAGRVLPHQSQSPGRTSDSGTSR
jgi:hypothetical protein